jgi:tryptophanyl-tRNA synthetase
MAFLALGLDPARAILFRQSDIPEILELYWILGTVVPLSNLDRAHSYKDKVARGISADFGLFAYPVLMAADILLYGSDVVPVCLGKVSDRQGSSTPEALVQESTAVLPGTDGQRCQVLRQHHRPVRRRHGIKRRIMGIKTDNASGGPKPLDALPTALGHAPRRSSRGPTGPGARGGWGYGSSRLLLAAYHATFDAARGRYRALEKDPAEVDRILRTGAERARAVAAPVIAQVRTAVGIER